MSYQEKALQEGQAAAWIPTAEAGEPSTSSRAQRPPKPPKPAAQRGSFGGRVYRYDEHKHQLLRAFDPFKLEYVTFSLEREYRAWLIPLFDPGVVSIDTSPKPIAYMRLGQKVTAKPLLQWKASNGRTVCLWLKTSWSVGMRRAYEHFATTHNIDVVLKTPNELDAQEVLIDNLQHAQQVLSTAAHAGVDLTCVCDAIEEHMKRNPDCTRGELGAELTCRGCLSCADHLDAALFFLHACGAIRLELEMAALDDDTRIQRL